MGCVDCSGAVIAEDRDDQPEVDGKGVVDAVDEAEGYEDVEEDGDEEGVAFYGGSCGVEGGEIDVILWEGR